MKGCVHESNLVVVHDFEKLLFGLIKVFRVLLFIVILKSYFNSAVIFEKFYFVALTLRVFLYLLEKVLTMQPDHLYRTQINTYFLNFFICHTNFVIANL